MPLNAKAGWWCCIECLNSHITMGWSGSNTSPTQSPFLSVTISSKNFPRKKYLVTKWSRSVCIGVCFYVYMVYSSMACLNYIASILCIVCLFFMCIYWTKWYDKGLDVESSLNFSLAVLSRYRGLFAQWAAQRCCVWREQGSACTQPGCAHTAKETTWLRTLKNQTFSIESTHRSFPLCSAVTCWQIQ